MKKIFIILFIAIGLTGFKSDVPLPAGDFVVIVNKDNPIAALSAGEAKLYFTRKLKSRWPGINKNIRPATRKNKCAERDAFYGIILKMGDSEVDNYFAERQFQNAEKPPEKFGSDAEVIEFVGQEVGGIGFINSKSATADAKSKVKVVLEF